MYTLEGVATAIMMIFLISFIVKASPLTPLTSSTSHQQVESQIETRGNDLLIVLDTIPEEDTYSPLKEALIRWYGFQFNGQSDVYPTPLYNLYSGLNCILLNDGTAYNMEVSYLNNTSTWNTRAMLWNGRPSDNAVLVTRKVAIHNQDKTYLQDNGFNQSWIVTRLPDLSNTTDFYNIVEVRLTLWRM